MTIFEVEMKFRVDDPAELERRLRDFGFPDLGGSVTEKDTFFRHPCRDFVLTDECLRLRQRTYHNDKPEYYLTYKGSKIDAETKTRQEIEMPIVSEPETLTQILSALGFAPAAEVCKFRRRTGTCVRGRHIEAVLDELPDLLPECRHFVELETLANESDVEECRSLLRHIAAELGLTESIRESYLKLVQAGRFQRSVICTENLE